MLFTLGASLLTKFGLGEAVARRFAWAPLAVGAIIAIGLIYSIATNWFDSAIDIAEDKGAAGAIIQGQNQTLDQLKDANDAETKLRTAGPRNSIAYNECLRNNRNKPACERYNPDAGQ